jgi:hypothetical protein
MFPVPEKAYLIPVPKIRPLAKVFCGIIKGYSFL